MGAISEPNHHLCIPLNGLWCPGSLGLDSGISVYFDGVFCQSTDVWVRKSSYPVNIRISVGREGDSSSLRLRLHEVEGAGRNMVLFQQSVVKEAQVHFGCKHTFADGKAAGYCTAPDNAFSDTGGTIGDVSDVASRMHLEHSQQSTIRIEGVDTICSLPDTGFLLYISPSTWRRMSRLLLRISHRRRRQGNLVQRTRTCWKWAGTRIHKVRRISIVFSHWCHTQLTVSCPKH